MQLHQRWLGPTLEAVYADEPNHAEWLENVGAALCALIGGEQHAIATYNWDNEASQANFTSPFINNISNFDETWPRIFDSYSPDDSRRALCGPPTKTMLAHATRPIRRLIADHFAEPDFVRLLAFDSDGAACVTGVPFSTRVTIDRSAEEVLGYVMAHLTAAHRVRRYRGTADAVLEPDGRVAHAERAAEGALQELREAVRSAERARMATASQVEALAAWTAVIQGRWTLVETIESDGRRYILARENEPSPSLGETFEVPALGRTELNALVLLGRGYAQKAIGYELGLSPPQVSRLLAKVRRTLGATSRAELARIAQAALLGAVPLSPSGVR